MSVNRQSEHAFDHLFAQIARGRRKAEEVGEPQPVGRQARERGLRGIVAYGEPATTLKILSLGLIIAGVVGLNLAGSH